MPVPPLVGRTITGVVVGDDLVMIYVSGGRISVRHDYDKDGVDVSFEGAPVKQSVISGHIEGQDGF